MTKHNKPASKGLGELHWKGIAVGPYVLSGSHNMTTHSLGNVEISRLEWLTRQGMDEMQNFWAYIEDHGKEMQKT